MSGRPTALGVSILKIAALGALMSVVIIAACGVRKQPAVDAPTVKPEKTNINRISLESLEEMFANMKGKAPWYKDGDLLWGYFFTDPDPKKLERAAERLTMMGYRFGSIYPTDDGTTHFLHVDRVETHTPQTLHLRNAELYALADEFDLESYDGMDVGPVLSD
ncbi:MAG TPA: ribonuclease E inhibitor RraB [Pyrinomonadaceae bacterium]